MEALRTTVDERDGWTVVRPRGQLDVATAPRFRQQLVEAGFTQAHNVVVDLDRVEYVDSLGLGVLIGGLKRARSHDARFVLACSSERLLRLLDLTGLDEVFELADSVEAVLGAAGVADPAGA